MRIAGINPFVFNPYGKSAIEIYVSGCTNGCYGCHSQNLWDFNFGHEVDFKELKICFNKYSGFFEIVSVLGGDLLCQNVDEAIEFSKFLSSYLHPLNKKLWLFTGKNEVPYWCTEYYDVIKFGPYNRDMHQKGFPASKNQRLIFKGIDY